MIMGFSPSSGAVGTLVTITGANFTGATAVTIPTAKMRAIPFGSPTQITAKVPPVQRLSIAVTTAGGIAASALSFTVTK